MAIEDPNFTQQDVGYTSPITDKFHLAAVGSENLQALSKGGARFDQGKSRVDLIPAEILLELGEIYRMGAEKYDASNWRKGMKWSKVYAPLLRHLYKAWIGKEINDPESGRPHIYHALWNVVALAFYMTRPEYKVFDDRLDNQDVVTMSEDVRQKLYV